MKIGIMSDIHLEFGKKDFILPDADVLLLAGDILVVDGLKPNLIFTQQGKDCTEFLQSVSEKYKKVIWIPGNHESYHGNISEIREIVYRFFDELNIHNITFIEQDTAIIDGVKFVFCTLWTDIDKANPLYLSSLDQYNDFKTIEIYDGETDRYLTPTDTMNFHIQDREFITKEVVGFDKVVVMTHHAPNYLSNRHPVSALTSMYCCTDMDDIILDNPQIKYWFHGHTHSNVEYKIGDTTVISNCRGYVGHENTSTFKVKVFEY